MSEISAATLTAIRERANRGPDGDFLFVSGCLTGHNGPVAKMAAEQAQQEAVENGDAHSSAADARIADRIIEFVNQHEIDEADVAVAS